MVFDCESVQERVCRTPLAPAPPVVNQVGVGPLVLKTKLPEVILSARSDLKVAVESAQSVPCELEALTR